MLLVLVAGCHRRGGIIKESQVLSEWSVYIEREEATDGNDCLLLCVAQTVVKLASRTRLYPRLIFMGYRSRVGYSPNLPIEPSLHLLHYKCWLCQCQL